MEEEQIEKLGAPRDRWEAEMIQIARRELDRASQQIAEGQSATTAALSHALLTQGENCRGYVAGLLYAVRRRREMQEDRMLES